jgi:2-oxoglutarate ferredoxin oxidoreductase subunit alpha
MFPSQEGTHFDVLQIRSFPFNDTVKDFIHNHEEVYVVEQNRDAQMRTLLINELEIAPDRLRPVLNYDGMPITADSILEQIRRSVQAGKKVSVS